MFSPLRSRLSWLIATFLTGVGVASGQAPGGDDARGSRSTVALLNQRIPEVSFSDQPLEKVMDWVQEYTGANVVVRWQTLEDSGVDRDKPISLRVRNLRFSQVLWMVMNEAGGADIKLAYRASGNLIVLSTAEDLGKELITKVYDISDLLTRAPRFANAAQLDPAQALQNVGQQQGGFGGGGGGGGGQGGQLFQGGMGQQNQEDDVDPQQDIDRIIKLIEDTVEPDTWTANGGTGSVRNFRSLLVVRNTILVHQRIGGLLRDDESP
ncbi:MAG: hypothetical protein SF069_18455 [Phycisphaerae bacterium]|nr:hypothetical protein [Phycisphaerae bacterium]